jgi:undecaprenyl-diphosphatase
MTLPRTLDTPNRSTGRHALWLAAALAVLAIPAMWVDLPIAQWWSEKQLPGEVRKLIALSEAFSHGTGMAIILLLVFVLDRAGRRFVPRLVVATVGGGLAANLSKMLVERTRPNSLPKGFDFNGPASVTFGDWLKFSGDSGLQSLPSAHTATGVALAVALTWRYPQGGWLFLVLAVLSSMQRMEVMAHYLSDVLLGAAVGCLIAGLCVSDFGPGRWFTRFEQRAETTQ